MTVGEVEGRAKVGEGGKGKMWRKGKAEEGKRGKGQRR